MTAIRPVTILKKALIGTVSAAVLSTAVLMSSGLASAATSGSFTLASGKSSYATIEDSFDGVVDTSFTVPSTTARPVYLGLQFRSPSGGVGYRTRVVIAADGTVRAGFSRVVNGAEKVLLSEPIALNVKAGDKLNLEGSVTGTSPVALKVRAWVGSVKPDWQKSYNDSAAERITTGNTVRAWGFLSGSATTTSAPITFAPATATATSTTAPSTTAPTSTPTAASSTSTPTAAPSSDAPTAAPSSSTPTAAPSTTAPSTTAPSTAAPAVLTKPSAATTGPTSTNLTRHDGNITVTKAGTVLEGLDIYGIVNVKAANVVIRNSIVRGATSYSTNVGLITNYGFENLVVEDVRVQPRVNSVWIDGVKGWNFTLNRVHVIGGVDNVKIHGDNVTIKNSLLEKTTYFASDPNQGGKATHNDSVQILKGQNLTLIGNTIRETTNFAILSGAEQGNVTLVAKNNWLDGGHCTVKMQNKAGYTQKTTVSDNKFGPNRVVAKCVIQARLDVTATATNNTMELTGAAVSILWDNA